MLEAWSYGVLRGNLKGEMCSARMGGGSESVL